MKKMNIKFIRGIFTETITHFIEKFKLVTNKDVFKEITITDYDATQPYIIDFKVPHRRDNNIIII
jgi:hypothetical protein